MFQLGGQKNGSLCCVTLHAGGIAVAVTSASRSGISHCAFLPAATLKEAYKLLADFVSQHRLKGSACHFVLQPNQYRLLYLDTPLVLEEELSKAARWLVKDLLQ